MYKQLHQLVVGCTSMHTSLPIVSIVWDDASALEQGWFDPAEEKDPKAQLVTTIGFLVKETDKYVVIAHTSDGSFVNGRFQIPKGMIKTIKPLKKVRKPKVESEAR